MYFFIQTFFRTCDGEDCGSSYLQALAQKLKEEYMNKPVQSILKEVQQLMRVRMKSTGINLIVLFYSYF